MQTIEERKRKACARSAQWRKDHPERVGVWDKENPERARAWRSARYKKDPQKWLHRRRLYRLKAQGVDITTLTPKPPTCPLCGRSDRMSADHDHKTGKFRGWLCNHCNWILGHALDSPALLRKLADYLERHLEQ